MKKIEIRIAGAKRQKKNKLPFLKRTQILLSAITFELPNEFNLMFSRTSWNTNFLLPCLRDEAR